MSRWPGPPAASVPPELQPAYEACRRLHAAHGRTYYLATRLLPRQRRPHVWALYAFARVADELVDDRRGPDAVALQRFSRSAMQLLSSPTGPDPVAEPVLAALWHTMATYRLQPTLVEEFLASMAMDLTVARYDTWADLRRYVRGSAAVIGELVAPVLGATATEATGYAGTLGEAFQLTNFIRDVAEDYQRGRVYLPQEDLARHGVTDADLAEAVVSRSTSRRLRELVRFEVARNLELYAAARPGLALLDRRGQACASVAFTLYRMILAEVVRADYDVFGRRHTVTTTRRVAVAGRLAVATLIESS